MAKKKDDETGDLGMAEVQEKVDAENAQGFRGTKVDPTPNENYTVAGVTSGAPTPETDPAYAREVRAQIEDRQAALAEVSGAVE